MSIKVMGAVWEHSEAQGATLLVALAVADFADDEGGAFPKISTLAAKARISKRTAQYAIRRLVKLGELTVDAGGKGPKNTNAFTVCLSRLKDKPKRTPPNDAKGAKSAPMPGAKGANGNTEGCNLRPRPIQNDPSCEPSVKQKRRAANKPPPSATKTKSNKGKKRRPKKKAPAKPTDSRIRTFFDWWATAYKAAVGRDYLFAGAKEGKNVKDLLRKLGNGDGVTEPLAELQAAATTMLADRYGRENASIGLLTSQINQWRTRGTARAAPTTADAAINEALKGRSDA